MNEIFLENMKELLKEDYELYLKSLKENKIKAIQVNTSKISTEEFEKICPFKISKIDWVKNGYYVEDDIRISKSILYYAGLFYIQEASAMAPVSALNPKNNDKIIDLCAAPGGKTLQLAIEAKNGVVLSNDISVSRLKAVIRNIEQFGLKNVIICANDVEKYTDKHLEYYDKVLLDAPCSGEGMFRKDADVMKYWNTDSNEKYSNIQKDLSEKVLSVLKSEGELVYSTCTFSILENEKIIKNLIDNFDIDLIDIENYENVNFDILSNGVAFLDDERLQKCKRLYPFKLRGEGHFVAKLKKNTFLEESISNEYEQNFDVESNEKIEIYQNGKYKYLNFNKAPKEFEEFCKNLLHENILYNEIKGVFKLNGEKLLLEPNFIPDLTGLRVLRRGWYLGDIVNGVFKPSQAFAMGLKAQWIKNKIVYDLEDEKLIKFLKCETLEENVENGWYVICFDKYPLGFVKALNGILKNKYPSSWRML